MRRMLFGRYDYASFLIYFTYAAGSVVVPVALVELARELQFPLEAGGLNDGGLLHLGRTAAMVVAMLACGFAAGWWGKRRTLGWAVLVMGLGVGLCAMAPGYGVLFGGLLIAGLGEGVVEGLATPLVQDLHPRESGRYINFSHGFWSVGVVITVLLAGGLLALGISWRLLVGCVGVLSVIPVLLLLLPARPGDALAEHPEPLHWRAVSRHAGEIARQPRFWLFYAAMFLAGGGEFGLTFWCAAYIQLHFSPDPWHAGLGTAIFSVGMVLGRTGWGFLLHQRHLPALVIASGMAGVLVTLPFPLLTSLGLFYALLFFAGIASAPFWPSIQSYATGRLAGCDSTMLLVLLSCAGVPGCGFFTWLMGWLGELQGSLSGAFYVIPACYGVLALLIAAETCWPHGAQKALQTPATSGPGV